MRPVPRKLNALGLPSLSLIAALSGGALGCSDAPAAAADGSLPLGMLSSAGATSTSTGTVPPSSGGSPTMTSMLPASAGTTMVPVAPTAGSAPLGDAAPVATSMVPTMAMGGVPNMPTVPSGAGSTSVEEEHTYDHCISGYDPEPTDATMADSFAEFEENGQIDATVQPEVIEWMERNAWQEAHFQWHQVRRCGGGGGPGGDRGVVDPCQYPEMLPQANECENARDGYEFLLMHRHMIQSLKQLWPNHTEQFEGWDRFPQREDYPELLRQYYSDWDQAVRQDAAIADDIENNLDMFADEGELGMWLQCGSLQGGLGAGSLHGALHFNGYPPQNQSHSVTNQRRNLDAYVFWKLHGWVDKVWERYRVAKGLPPDEPKLTDELIAQCREMDALSQLIDPSLVPDEGPTDLPDEAGYFHEVVRPALEDFGCATCHGEGEEARLRLGYEVSSTEIVERLVNRPSAYAVGYDLVVPGDPDSSWLYLKASGQSATSGATCQGVMNCTQAMPPSMGARLGTEALDALRQWIADGAEPPTVL